MKASDVVRGGEYTCKVSGKIVRVRVLLKYRENGDEATISVRNLASRRDLKRSTSDLIDVVDGRSYADRAAEAGQLALSINAYNAELDRRTFGYRADGSRRLVCPKCGREYGQGASHCDNNDCGAARLRRIALKPTPEQCDDLWDKVMDGKQMEILPPINEDFWLSEKNDQIP